MFLTTLSDKWRESLEIFEIKNFKLFLLASLNNLKRSIVSLSKSFFEPLALLIILIFMSQNLLQKNILNTSNILNPLIKINLFDWFSIIALLTSALRFSFLIYLSIRPSIEPKNSFYFFKHTKYFFNYLLLCIVFIPTIIIPTKFIVSSLFIFSVLFFLDSKNNFISVFYSILNSAKLILYNFPVIIILDAFKIIQDYSFKTSYFGIHSKYKYLLLTIIAILILFYLNMLAIYYTKIKHKDLNLFYTK